MVFLVVWFLGCRFESRRGRLIWFYFAYVYTLLVLGHAGILSRNYRCFLLVFSFIGTILIMVYFFLFSLSPLWGDDQQLVLGPLIGARALLDLNLVPPYMPTP